MARLKAATAQRPPDEFEGELGELPAVNLSERRAAEHAAQLEEFGISPVGMDDYLGPPAELLEMDDAYYSVFRVMGDKRRVYVCKYAPHEFDLERLHREHGGGHYWLRLIARNPANKGRPSGFWQAFPELEGEPILPKPAPLALDVAAAPVNHNSGLESIAQTMLAGFERIAASLARPVNADPAPTRRDMLEEMRLMQEMLPRPSAAPNPLGMLRDVMAIVREMQPVNVDAEASPASVMLTALDKLGPMLMPALAHLAGSAPARAKLADVQAASPRQPKPAGDVQLIAPPLTQPEGTEMNADDLRFNLGLRFLADAAGNDESPELYADIVLSKVPEEQVKALLSRPDWFEFIAARVPAVAPYRAWFEELRAVVLEPLEPEPAPEGDEAGTLTADDPARISGAS